MMRTPFSFTRGLSASHVLWLFLALVSGSVSASANDGIPAIFLHGISGTPSALFLDAVAPTATSPKYRDSATLVFSGGNPWREIGTWTAPSALFTGTVGNLNPLHAFVGLKNSDDEGARFDVRAEVYKNGLPLTSGQTLCVTDVRRNPEKAKEILVALDSFPEATFTVTDVISLKVLTRIGTTGTGAFCGGHRSSAGLRVYFDSIGRPARLAGPLSAGLDWNTGVGGNASRTAQSLATGPAAPSILWLGGLPAVYGLQAVIEGDILVSARTESYVPDDWFIVAQNLGSGKELWRVKLPITFPNPFGGHVSGIRGGQVYAKRESSGALSPEYLYALKASNGAILWRSEDTLDEEENSESLTFTDDGDLIVGNFYSITRINHLSGKTVWTTGRECLGSGGCMATVSGDHVYAWDYDSVNNGAVIDVFDVESGAKLYSNTALPFGIGPIQAELMAGPDGMVYAAVSGQNPNAHQAFVAFRDTGSALVEMWQVPTNYTGFASFGIGPDCSIYTYSPSDQVLRLDPATGSVRNASMPIPSFSGYGPRMAIDSAGRVFLTAESPAGGVLYSFNADLTLRWTDDVPSVFLGGPALGHDGTLVVCGAEIRAYRD